MQKLLNVQTGAVIQLLTISHNGTAAMVIYCELSYQAFSPSQYTWTCLPTAASPKELLWLPALSCLWVALSELGAAGIVLSAGA